MEQWQRDIIKRNLPALLELTKWNAEISATLTSKNILSPGDLDSLDTCYRSQGETVCAQRLYAILQTRTGGFEGVASALHKARQTGAFNILLKECVSRLAEQRNFLLPCPPISSFCWMLPRNVVSPEIFDYCVADLLVFKGIGFDELCSFAKWGQRVTFSENVDASEYVLLQGHQGEIDFKEIGQKAGKRNVHLLEYKRDSGGFLLVQSFGHVFNICQFLQDNENEPINNHNYFSTITFDSQVRVIECDPQMWNSFRNELEKRNEEVAFGVLGWMGSKFGKVDLAYSTIGKTPKELVQALLDCGSLRVQELLSRCQVEECHIILAILGRVENERLTQVRGIIHKVCSEIGNIRFWIQTSAEVWRLERVFRVRAWRMKAAENSFMLISGSTVVSPIVECELHWLYPVLPSDNPYFSSPPVLNLLKNARNVGQGEDVAQICEEIFASCVSTLTLWLGTAASSDVQLELMRIGLRSLFPGHVDLIQGGGGGIQSGKQISFVCEDIAAFAVAKLLAEESNSNHMEMLKLDEFLTTEVFQLDEKRRFKNYRVFYFLDHFLGQECGRESRILQIIHKIVQGSMYSALFVRRCIAGRFAKLLKIFAEEPDTGQRSPLIKDNFIMKLAGAFGNVHILDYVCQVNSLTCGDMDLLGFAMKRGDITIVSNLLGRKSCNLEMEDYSIALSACVGNSCLDSEPIISQKKEIFDQFLDGMTSKDKAGCDISFEGIHFQLFKHLISVGMVDIDDSRMSIVQSALSHFTPAELHELVVHLASIQKMIFFNSIDDTGRTALHHILIRLQILPETLDVLQVHDVDFNRISNDDLSLLSCAILGNQSGTVVTKIVDCGADINFKNKFGNGLLHLATFYGNFSAMLVLLEAGCRDVSERNMFGYAPIHLTFISESKDNFIESLRLLLRHGADVDCTDASGSTPLFWAVTRCKKDEWLDAVSFLVKRGANLRAKDNDGQSMIHRAASERSPKQYHELIQWLIDNSDGSLLKEKFDFKCTALHYAVLHLELMEATLDLLLKYMDINHFGKHGNSVLMYAIRGGRDRIFLKMLLEKGADWRVNNCRRFNALHQAAKYGNVDALQLFIEKGCDVHNVTVDGETPLHVAFQNEDNKMNDTVSFLLKNNGDVNTKDTKGRTPFDLAEARHANAAGMVDAMRRRLDELMIKGAKPKSNEIFKHVRFPLSLLPNHGE